MSRENRKIPLGKNDKIRPLPLVILCEDCAEAYSFSYCGRGTIPPSPLYTRGAFSRVPRHPVILSVSDSEERTPSHGRWSVLPRAAKRDLVGRPPKAEHAIAWENGRLHLTMAYSFSYCSRGTIPQSPLATAPSKREPTPVPTVRRRGSYAVASVKDAILTY